MPVWGLCEDARAQASSILSRADAERIDKSNIIPREILEAMKGAGLFRVDEISPGELFCRVRALAYMSPAVAHTLLVHASAWLAAGRPSIGSREIYALSVTEPGGGSDVKSNLRTEARLSGSSCILNGEKIFTSNSPYASTFIVLAAGASGPTLYAVRRGEWIEYELLELSGLRGTGAARVLYRNAPAERTGTPGRGLLEALRGINLGRAGYAAIALGIIDRSMEIIIETGSRKVVFGRELLSYQGIRWRIAELYISKSLLESILEDIASRAGGSWIIDPAKAAVAKTYGAQAAQAAAWYASQILGGRGLTMWSETERMQRDARTLDIGEGSREVILEYLSKTAIKSARTAPIK